MHDIISCGKSSGEFLKFPQIFPGWGGGGGGQRLAEEGTLYVTTLTRRRSRGSPMAGKTLRVGARGGYRI